MGLMDIPSELLKPLDLTMSNFLSVIAVAKPTVGPGDMVRQKEWTELYGMDG
jgi:hypothetical protein